MGALAWRARAGVLLLVGAVGVHQLVYGLAGVRPDEHVHAYLNWLTPALFGLLCAAAGELAVRALGFHRRTAPPPSGEVLWPALSALLVTIFAAQEAAEAVLGRTDGHGHALGELVIGHGLWISVPSALLVGAILALALRGAAAVEAWRLTVEPGRPSAPPAPFVERRRPPLRSRRAPRDVLGRHLAGRAPPVVMK